MLKEKVTNLANLKKLVEEIQKTKKEFWKEIDIKIRRGSSMMQKGDKDSMEPQFTPQNNIG